MTEEDELNERTECILVAPNRHDAMGVLCSTENVTPDGRGPHKDGLIVRPSPATRSREAAAARQPTVLPPLTDKVALVTGGSRGIGAAIARRLSGDGAIVAITYRQSMEEALALAAELEAQGGRVRAVCADNASVDEVQHAVRQVAEEFGRLDILVNNAAVSHAATIDVVDLDHLNEMLAVNVRGSVVAIQESVRHMQVGGRVINIGSISSDFMPFAGQSIYAMTKGALASLTRGLARDLGPRGITVNNVQPGRIDTALVRDALGSHFEDARRLVPMRRFGAVRDVADLVAFLASPQASFINGANLRVDGGVSA